jgi:hypothetical protein
MQSTKGYDEIVNYWTALQPFPHLKEFELKEMGEETIEGFPSRSLLCHLHLESATMRTFPFQMAILHGLEELRLDYTIILPNSWHDVIEIPTLRRLSVLETEDFMWDKLKTPFLQKLVMDDESAVAADFICRALQSSSSTPPLWRSMSNASGILSLSLRSLSYEMAYC